MIAGEIDGFEVTLTQAVVIDKVAFQIVAAVVSGTQVVGTGGALARIAVDVERVPPPGKGGEALPELTQSPAVTLVVLLEHLDTGGITEDKDAIGQCVRCLFLFRLCI